MPDTKYPVSGSIRMWWIPLNGLARPAAPTAAEIAAGLDISDAVSWNDKDFGTQPSSTSSDPAITARGNVQTRGAAQYGGSLSFYYPRLHNDNTNLYSLVYDALRLPDTQGYLVVRLDGLELEQASGTAAQPGRAIAAGDLVSVYRVATAGYAEAITGEEAFRYTVSFLPRGFVKTMAVVRAAAAAIPPTVDGPSAATIAGGPIVLNATILSRNYTRGVRWSTTTPNLAMVSANGVVTPLAAGSASILATDEATGAPSTPKTIAIT